ncbi:MAG: polysaccharide deacetylase family protein [Verrucomicrobiales bacterium]|nr:polysaccharide deacetylase family protein [Verrucomicrobiales bacterium]
MSKKHRKKAGEGLDNGWDPGSRIRGSVGRKDSYRSVNTSARVLALTFDDGPHPTNTPRLLDMLKKRNVRATFYVVGSNARRYPHIMRRMIAEGHEIGNHTFSHSDMKKMSKTAIKSDLQRTQQMIVSGCGVTPRTMRPPYGSITADQKSWIRRELGYPTITWSVDPEDWKKPGSSVVSSRLINGAKPGAILLAHDIHAPTIDAMPRTLDTLLSKGYRFVTVTQLIALEGQG